jgi:SAM-dependent methyltransferase
MRDDAHGGRVLSSGWGLPFALRAAPGGGMAAFAGMGGCPPQPSDGRGGPTRTPPARDASVIWHEVECGGYAADLPLWENLADESDGTILDLGCGTGRVARHLARRGHEVVGLDADPAFVAELVRDGGAGVLEDARDFELGREFGLVLAPMQLVQLFGDAGERVACLRCVRRHLAAGGVAAFAIVESMPAPVDAAPPLPDAREVDGWVYSSLPIEATVGGGAIRLRRLRQAVSPAGGLSEEVDEVLLRTLDAATLEAEAAVAGLRPAGRRPVAATDAHVGSTVVLFERGP